STDQWWVLSNCRRGKKIVTTGSSFLVEPLCLGSMLLLPGGPWGGVGRPAPPGGSRVALGRAVPPNCPVLGFRGRQNGTAPSCRYGWHASPCPSDLGLPCLRCLGWFAV